MARPADDAAAADAAAAIERVLRAERDADARLALARDAARATLDAARDDARAIVERAAERAARWQRGHAAALDRRLEALRAQAAAAPPLPVDDVSLDAAIERLALRMTSGDDTGAGA